MPKRLIIDRTLALLGRECPTTPRIFLSPSSSPSSICLRRLQLRSGHSSFARDEQQKRQQQGEGDAVWLTSFSRVAPRRAGGMEEEGKDYKPPDERTLRLGKTLRILQPRLPTLLQTPLPQEILSPQITLHLFPSTHPHLPTVTGRVAYVAALWTAPVAWGRVPIVGNVRLEILSERMVKGGVGVVGEGAHGGDERLIVRWRTIGSRRRGRSSSEVQNSTSTTSPSPSSSSSDVPSQPIDKIKSFLSSPSPSTFLPYRNPTSLSSPSSSSPTTSPDPEPEDDDDEFTGLFIFTFDPLGRILSHTIEHLHHDDSSFLSQSSWDKMRVVNLTDWLLGKMGDVVNRRKPLPVPDPAPAGVCSTGGGGAG